MNETRPEPEGGPEDGHTFWITYASRGSYSVVGDPSRTDAGTVSVDKTVAVRAWNLHEAFAKAIDQRLFFQE